jgi:hypothetical protein
VKGTESSEFSKVYLELDKNEMDFSIAKRRSIYIYIYEHVWQRWKPSLTICWTMFQRLISAESFPVSQLCVNTLLATKVTLITDGI